MKENIKNPHSLKYYFSSDPVKIKTRLLKRETIIDICRKSLKKLKFELSGYYIFCIAPSFRLKY